MDWLNFCISSSGFFCSFIFSRFEDAFHLSMELTSWESKYQVPHFIRLSCAILTQDKWKTKLSQSALDFSSLLLLSALWYGFWCMLPLRMWIFSHIRYCETNKSSVFKTNSSLLTYFWSEMRWNEHPIVSKSDSSYLKLCLYYHQYASICKSSIQTVYAVLLLLIAMLLAITILFFICSS